MMFRARWLRLSRPFLWAGVCSGSFVVRSWWIMSALFCMVRWFDSSRRFWGFCGFSRGFYRLFDNFIWDSVKRASRGFCAVAPMAAYRRGLIRAFIRRFKRLLWLRGYLFGYSVKMPLWGFSVRSVACYGSPCGWLSCQLLRLILCIYSPINLVGMSANLTF